MFVVAPSTLSPPFPPPKKGRVALNLILSSNPPFPTLSLPKTTTKDVKTAAVGSLNAKSAIWDAKKSFDIKHPTKEDHRLRYICLEGPTADVYLKGKLVNQSYIELPDYWKDFVDMDNIIVNLTPNGHWQELYVEKIEWGTKVIIKNNSGTGINCDYVIFAERKDTSKNISEYQGLTPADYPGDNREYNINGK